jgi:hypothetical protein
MTRTRATGPRARLGPARLRVARGTLPCRGPGARAHHHAQTACQKAGQRGNHVNSNTRPFGCRSASSFPAIARCEGGEPEPTDCGPVIILLVTLFGAWVVGVPLAVIALSALTAAQGEAPPRWQVRRRAVRATPALTARRSTCHRALGGCGPAGRMRRARLLPCRAAAPTTHVRSRGHATPARGARSLGRRGHRPPPRLR